VLHSSTSKNSTTVRSAAPSTGALRLARAALQAAFALSDGLGATLAERLFTSPRRFARPERERTILATGRPFEVEVTLRSPRWNHAKTRVAAWRWGNGPTVLLVHGWEGRGSQLGAVIEPLVAAGLSVVTFDAPGHGDSPGSRLYLTDLADAVGDVANAVGPLHATISHSFGCAAVLLAHARAGLDAPLNVAISPNVLIDDAIARFAKLVALDDLERAALEAGLTRHSGLGLDGLQLSALVARRDADLLVLHDREDGEIPVRHGEALAATWPGARLELTEGLGHRRILRDPAVVAEVVAFVRRGVRLPVSDLVREVDRALATLDL
jgi:pimeloyl-ACP methyl ester carboxylesterase